MCGAHRHCLLTGLSVLADSRDWYSLVPVDLEAPTLEHVRPGVAYGSTSLHVLCEISDCKE